MSFPADFLRKNGPEFRALLMGGLPSFILSPTPGPLGQGIPAFCYHLADPDRFEQDLQFLRDNGYGTLTADGLLDHLAGISAAPPRSVVLTFDDGAVNFYRVAFPLLKQYGQQAVLFIAPGLHRNAAEETATDRRPCTWEELDEMHASGRVDLQSHSWAHRSLLNWPTPLPLAGIDAACVANRLDRTLTMEEDLKLARDTLEERFSKKVRHLAWPQYVGGADALNLARSVGYKAFWCGTLPHHPLNIPKQDPLTIVRVSGEFVRRLPGRGRRPLPGILCSRYANAIRKRREPRKRKSE